MLVKWITVCLGLINHLDFQIVPWYVLAVGQLLLYMTWMDFGECKKHCITLPPSGASGNDRPKGQNKLNKPYLKLGKANI